MARIKVFDTTTQSWVYADKSFGKDGESITITNITESSDDGGSNMVTFSDGKTLTVKNGKTPVRSVDYWTEADQESIVQQVLTVMGMHIVGVVNENNDIVFSGDLNAGTYTLKFEDIDGNVQDVGVIEIVESDDEIIITYTNQIPISTDVDGSIYNGVGYKENTRWSKSGGGDIEATGITVSGYIPVKTGDVIRIKNITMNKNGAANTCAVCYFWSRTATDGAAGDQTLITSDMSGVFDAQGNLTQFTIPESLHPTYIRLNTAYIGPDSILTINEEIPEEEPAYTNLADTTSADWLTDIRLNSSCVETAQAGAITTNYIPLKADDVVRVKGLNIFYMGNGNSTLHFYNSSKTNIGKTTPGAQPGIFDNDGYNPPTKEEFKYTVGTGSIAYNTGYSADNIAYIRFVGVLLSGYTAKDVVITVNQEITD